jgi:hypothetical protein
MSAKMAGVRSQYSAVFVDSKGRPLDGAKTYRLHLPPNIPAKDFWSILLYDNQTRSMLQTDEPRPSVGSQRKGIIVNPDTSGGSVFRTDGPEGQEKQMGAILRL